MLADQVTARQIERVDHRERDDRRYRTTVEEGIGVFDEMSCRVPLEPVDEHRRRRKHRCRVRLAYEVWLPRS
jgi:hypothetical protein